MALPHAIPFGLRDIRLTPYVDDAATQLDTTSVDLPVARTLSFSDAEEFTELAGDDQTVAAHGAGALVEWELESGGISLEAWAVLSGGDVTETGTDPDITSKSVKVNTRTGSKPYFQIEGQAISDSGGDVHCVIFKAKVTDSLEGEFTNGEFFLTTGSGQGFPSTVAGSEGDLYEFTQNQARTDITTGTV